VILAPHPGWRRLFANGAVPALTVDRMTQARRRLERLAFKSPLPQWVFAPSLEALLRSIDLSDIERKVLAIGDSRAAHEVTRDAGLRRTREHVEQQRKNIADTAAPAAEQPPRLSARDAVEIAAILQRYGSDTPVAELARSVEIGPVASTAAAGQSRPAPPTISRADAAASLLRRSARAGDQAIARRVLAPGAGPTAISDLSERSAEGTDTSTSQH
jgi:hypothetical protein